MQLYNSYSSYFKDLFGDRVQKVTINAGFTCPNRDGTVASGGCTFCLNEAFNPSYCSPLKSVTQQIDEGIEFHSRRYAKVQKYLAYFQAFSNTYKPLDELKAIYSEALKHEHVVGLVIGTRPDCIDEEKLAYFAELSKQKYVILEYGVESVNDATLEAVNRGHNFAKAVEAINLTHKYGIHVGAHFILGLPGETKQMFVDQVDTINRLPLDTVKFHQLQIFKGTAMEVDYNAHPERYNFFELDEYIDLMVDIFERLRSDIVVERFAGESPPRYHAGHPWGLVRNEKLWQMLQKRLIERNTFQGKLYICTQ